ncbi:MAG: hypothetical protein R3D57_00680 [Hyphomicrobiaceae bacterium]
MAEPSSTSEQDAPKKKPHWRLYAVIVAVLATVVTVTNGVNAVSKFPSSVAELKRWLWPGPEVSPVSLTVAKEATKPSPGYGVVQVTDLGEVFGGGADVRLVLQAQSPDRIAQVVKLTTKVKRLEAPAQVAFNVDPLAQPGFGAARPETFQVTVEGETAGTATYIGSDNTAASARFPELLPSDPPLVYRFGGTDGAQETIDLKLRLRAMGIYEVRFVATVVSDNTEYQVESAPLRVGRK